MDNLILKQYGYKIYNLLSNYVDIDNDLIKKTNSVFSIFKPINFEEIRQKIISILVLLKKNEYEINHLNGQNDLTKHQKNYIKSLLDYIEALKNTIKLFLDMITDLAKRSKNENKLNFKQHLNNDKTYQDSKKKYMQIGQELSFLYEQLD